MARRPKRKMLDDDGVAALKPKPKRYAVPDPELRAHYIRVQPSGKKTFVVVARDLSRKQVWQTIGEVGLVTIDQARDAARATIKAIRSGKDPKGPQSFKSIADQWFERHVIKKGLRTRNALRTRLDNHVLPSWAGREFKSIRRSDVALLLDKIEDNSGPVAADKVLAIISGIFNWYLARHENYSTPIVRAMRRSNPKERARDRILSDNELRMVWHAANGSFGAIVRTLLLTGQRLDKVASNRWMMYGLTAYGQFPLRAARRVMLARLMLPEMALAAVEIQPRLSRTPTSSPDVAAAISTASARPRQFLTRDFPICRTGRCTTYAELAARSISRGGIRPDIA